MPYALVIKNINGRRVVDVDQYKLYKSETTLHTKTHLYESVKPLLRKS